MLSRIAVPSALSALSIARAIMAAASYVLAVNVVGSTPYALTNAFLKVSYAGPASLGSGAVPLRPSII